MHNPKPTRGARAAFLLAVALATLATWRPTLADERKVQPESTLSIQVSGEPSLSREYKVNEQGEITMEMVGTIKVADLTVDEVKQKVTDELSKYLKLFEVTVAITSDLGVRAYVYGEVARPGAVRVRPGSTLLDVLADAGQPTANADKKRIKILQKATGAEIIRDLQAVIEDSKENVPIAGGDIITVPSTVTHLVQIDGEVRSPGMRSLEYFKTLYAMIQAAGPTEATDWTKIALRHKDSSTPMLVDLTDVRAGRAKDDIELKPGDHVTVMSRITGTALLRGAVSSPGEKILTDKLTVWDLISTAGGGFAPLANRAEVEIMRGGKVLQKVNLEEAAKGNAEYPDAQVQVEPGDVIFVPNNESRRFTIIGGVRNSGEHIIKPGMTLLDAIFAASGLTPNAIKDRVLFSPEDPKDPRLENLKRLSGLKRTSRAAAANREAAAAQAGVPLNAMAVVDLKKLLEGDQTQNFEIRPGDQILVPEKQPRNGGFLTTALRVLPFARLFLW